MEIKKISKMLSKILKWVWDKLSEEKQDRIKKILENSVSFRNLVSILGSVLKHSWYL